MNEPALITLVNKVSTKKKNGMDYLDAEVEQTMKGGKMLKGNGKLIDKGNHFLDKEHAKEKFRYLVANAMKEKEALAIVTSIYDLPKRKDIKSVSETIKSAIRHI